MVYFLSVFNLRSQAQTDIQDTTSITIIQPSKEKEKEIFSDSKLNYKHEVVAKKGMMEKFLEWLAEMLFGKAGYDNVNTARQILIWSVIILSIVIIVWLLSRSELVSLVKPKSKATAFNFSDVTEDLGTINFDQKINEAEKQSDYRLAIRWHYLKILFLLDKKGLINFASFKTNIDYGNELKGKPYHPGFIRLSRIYEYVWYGQFELNETSYHNNASEFKTIERQLHV